MDEKENKALQKETQQSYQETKQLNKTTIDAIKEGRKIARNQSIKGYRSVEELRNRL